MHSPKIIIHGEKMIVGREKEIKDKDYHLTLERRKKLLRDAISAKSVVHSTLITTYGLKHNEYSGDFVSVITMDDLFA